MRKIAALRTSHSITTKFVDANRATILVRMEIVSLRKVSVMALNNAKTVQMKETSAASKDSLPMVMQLVAVTLKLSLLARMESVLRIASIVMGKLSAQMDLMTLLRNVVSESISSMMMPDVDV